MNEIGDALGIKNNTGKQDDGKTIGEMIVNDLQTANTGDNSAEKILVIFAYIILVAGILASLISAICLSENIVPSVLALVMGATSSLLIWAVLKVLANISTNLRHIRQDLHKLSK
jgi:hypothetical protein